MREPFLKLYQKTKQTETYLQKINPIKAAELSRPEHLTSGRMPKDLSTETKYLKPEKGIVSEPTTIHFFSCYIQENILQRSLQGSISRTKTAAMYVKNEKLLLFSFKLSISTEILEILKKYLKHSFQVFLLLKKHHCLNIHRSNKNRKRKMFVHPDL